MKIKIGEFYKTKVVDFGSGIVINENITTLIMEVLEIIGKKVHVRVHRSELKNISKGEYTIKDYKWVEKNFEKIPKLKAIMYI